MSDETEWHYEWSSVVEALMSAQVVALLRHGRIFQRAILSPGGAVVAAKVAGSFLLCRAKGDRVDWIEGAQIALVTPLAPIQILVDPACPPETGTLVDGETKIALRLNA